MIVAKYGISNVWNPCEIRRRYSSSLWKGIVKHLDQFKKGVGYEIGTGDNLFLGGYLVWGKAAQGCISKYL